MNTRRKFLIQGSIATAAVLALKPFTSIARAASTFAGPGGSTNQLVILHTAHLHSHYNNKVIQHIANIKKNNANAILLNAGYDTTQDETTPLTYDVPAITGDYKIIKKGNIKTGVISVKPGDSDVIQKVNTLSAWLKKEKNCTVVVCLSQLGYKNKNTTDDITLAGKSTHLDMIIGGHKKNFHRHPVIALNSNNGEVIIHSAAGDITGLGKIEIDFDGRGQKNHVSFAGKSSNTTMPAA
jgi:hypothetical protein